MNVQRYFPSLESSIHADLLNGSNFELGLKGFRVHHFREQATQVPLPPRTEWLPGIVTILEGGE